MKSEEEKVNEGEKLMENILVQVPLKLAETGILINRFIELVISDETCMEMRKAGYDKEKMLV